MNFQHLAYEALNLPHQFRAELAQKLLLSLDEVTKSEKLWFDEALYRSEKGYAKKLFNVFLIMFYMN